MFNLCTLSKFFPLRLNVRLINATFDCAVIDLQKQADMVQISGLVTGNPAKTAAKFELIYIPASELIRTFAT